MSATAALLTHIDAYVAATSLTQRLAATEGLRRVLAGHGGWTSTLDELLLRARTLGTGRTPAESPIAFLLPSARSCPQVAALSFTRMLVPSEAQLLLESPLWDAPSRTDVLDRIYWPDAELPPVAFAIWTRLDPPDWAHIDAKRSQHPRRAVLLGPSNPRGPDWVRSLPTLGAAAYPGAASCWLLRAIAFQGASAIATATQSGLDLTADALADERSALCAHPDQTVVRLVRGLMPKVRADH